MVHQWSKPRKSPQTRAHKPSRTPAYGDDVSVYRSTHNLSSRILYLQRTIGNQAVIRLVGRQKDLSHTGDRRIQRELGGGLTSMTLYDLFGALKQDYEGPIGFFTVKKYFIPQYTSVAAVAEAMGLKKKSTGGGAKTKVENVEKKLEKVIEPVVPLLKKKTVIPPKKSVLTPTKKKVLIPPKKKVVTPTKKTVLTRPKRKRGAIAKTTTHTVTYKEVPLVVADVFAKKETPSKEDFMTALKTQYQDKLEDLVNNPAFVYDFQYAIRTQVEKDDDSGFLEKTQLYDVAEPQASLPVKEGKAYTDLSKWTLRHYTPKGTETNPPPFKEIKSAMGLALMDGKKQERKSGHTGGADWNRYGNTGNTFYLLCINGEVMSNQPFLKDAKWYAEIPFALPSLWISSDWLKEADIKGEALRGSGKAVHNALVTEIGVKGLIPHGTFISILKTTFHNLEVKVPGSVPVTEWKKV